jgi:hypothetical protein
MPGKSRKTYKVTGGKPMSNLNYKDVLIWDKILKVECRLVEDVKCEMGYEIHPFWGTSRLVELKSEEGIFVRPIKDCEYYFPVENITEVNGKQIFKNFHLVSFGTFPGEKHIGIFIGNYLKSLEFDLALYSPSYIPDVEIVGNIKQEKWFELFNGYGFRGREWAGKIKKRLEHISRGTYKINEGKLMNDILLIAVTFFEDNGATVSATDRGAIVAAFSGNKDEACLMVEEIKHKYLTAGYQVSVCYQNEGKQLTQREI